MPWWLAAVAHAAGPCLTPALLPDLVGVQPRALPAPPPGAGKAEREALDGVADSLASDHFVLKWGSSLSVSDADAQSILDAFELSFAVEVGQMEHPAPSGMDAYKFNVYVADSGLRWGGSELGSYGAAGYYYTDPDGWPIIVLAPSTVESPDYGRTTVAHEFYHAVQHATGSYLYDDDAGWFWEASAVWVEAEVYTEDPAYAGFLFGFAFLPHYPVDFFDYYDTGAFTEYYQYGAFIFPRFLSEQVGDWSILRDAWVDPGEHDDDPVARLDEVLREAWGTGVDEVFPAFAEANATWDYADQDTYTWYLDYYSDYFGDQDESVTARIDGGGTEGLVEVDAERRPYRYGTNYLWLDGPDQQQGVVRFEGDAAGSLGSAATWAVSVGVVGGGGVDWSAMALVDEGAGPAGEVALSGLSGGDEVVVVVSAWSDAREEGEQFGYAYAFAPEGEPSGTGDPGAGGDGGSASLGFSEPAAQGCCATAGAARGGPLGLLLLLAGLLRRRRLLS